jgi:uncharacterized membrane protein YfcA
MTSYLVVALTALLAAGLTLYSGFGLGTLLLPVFALFYPVELAVVATAMVHGANNVFKVSLVGRYADWGVVWRFGLPAVLFAALGAWSLGALAQWQLALGWQLGSLRGSTTPLRILMGMLIFTFALFELLPGLKRIQFDRRYLPLGGILSGYFGGLSGHQGALRSAFLVKTGLGTEAFVGTNAVIGLSVDLVRLATYVVLLTWLGGSLDIPAGVLPLVLTGVLAAFSGVVIGKRYLHKVTMRQVQNLTGVLLLLVAVALGLGLI